MKSIGVLALQGAVSEHINVINSLGHKGIEIKKVEQIKDIDGLIIPGGESTAIGKLMKQFGFIEAIRDFSANGKPIFGTCAGMVLLSSGADEERLNLMNIDVVRNGFGRQKESFEVKLNIKGLDEPFPAVFIRAPYVNSTQAEVLSTIDEKIVFVRQDNLIACSFHPELTNDNRIIKMFLDMV